jgi:hypothetical protein
VVEKKKNNRKKLRAEEEEEWNKGSLNPPKNENKKPS